MADYYIISQDDRNETANVIIHFPVPAGSNDGGRTWQSIVAELRAFNGETGSQVPWLNDIATPDTVNALDAGELYELSFSYQDDGKLSTAARATNLDAAVQAKISEFSNEFATIYRFYGTKRTVT